MQTLFLVPSGCWSGSPPVSEVLQGPVLSYPHVVQRIPSGKARMFHPKLTKKEKKSPSYEQMIDLPRIFLTESSTENDLNRVYKTSTNSIGRMSHFSPVNV